MLKQRLWIEDFKIYNDPAGRRVRDVLKQWKEVRRRPTHFVKAILIYKALLDGDLNCFFDLLIEIAPRTAYALMQNSSAVPSDNRAEKINNPQLVYQTQVEEQSEVQKIDALADSLGLGDLTFE